MQHHICIVNITKYYILSLPGKTPYAHRLKLYTNCLCHKQCMVLYMAILFLCSVLFFKHGRKWMIYDSGLLFKMVVYFDQTVFISLHMYTT